MDGTVRTVHNPISRSGGAIGDPPTKTRPRKKFAVSIWTSAAGSGKRDKPQAKVSTKIGLH